MQLFADGLALLDQQSFTSRGSAALQQVGREPSPPLHLQAHPKPVRHRRAAHQGVVLRPLAAALRRHTRRHRHRQLEAQIRGRNASVASRVGRIRSPERPRQLRLRTPRRRLPNSCPNLPTEAAPAAFEATALGHPLLPAHVCIRNDVSLDATTRFYLISGSNMAGKSTLLRAIGTNTVLAYAGAPVRATALRLTPLTIGASLALTDSLAENKSKFLAEVERLHAISSPASSPHSLPRRRALQRNQLSRPLHRRQSRSLFPALTEPSARSPPTTSPSPHSPHPKTTASTSTWPAPTPTTPWPSTSVSNPASIHPQTHSPSSA